MLEGKNPELLRAAVKNILIDPSKHNQNSWISRKYDEQGGVCGTTMCLAGYVAMEAGADLPPVADPEWDGDWHLSPEGKFRTSEQYMWEDTNTVEVSDWSAKKVGLDYEEREYLFYAFVGAEEIAQRVEDVIEAWDEGKAFDPWEGKPCTCGCNDDEEENY